MSKFIDDVKRIHDKHYFKITNSYGCRDYYRYFRNKRKSKIPEALFRKILESVIDQIFDEHLSKYLRVRLPSKVGDLYIKCFKFEVKQRADGSYYKPTPVDWNKTLLLWESDPEAYEKRIVVKHELPFYHSLLYKTRHNDFRNHQVFQLQTCRKLNKKIHQQMTLYNFF